MLTPLMGKRVNLTKNLAKIDTQVSLRGVKCEGSLVSSMCFTLFDLQNQAQLWGLCRILASISMFLLILKISGASGNSTFPCDHSETSITYLDVAVEMIHKAKLNFPVCPAITRKADSKPLDCEDLLRSGHNESGLYTLWPRSRVTDERPLDVFCDMDIDGGGWTVIQRRGNYDRPKDFFFKDWKSYKVGFGDLEKEFWLGDSMIQTHGSQKFSTKEQDNDSNEKGNCADSFKGGWWYGECHQANLNGESHGKGFWWKRWRGIFVFPPNSVSNILWSRKQLVFAVEAYFSNSRSEIAAQRIIHRHLNIPPRGRVTDRKCGWMPSESNGKCLKRKERASKDH
ncbi:techylectin-like protein [Trichonephila clavipes]|nr:techylectin-like protein [Trichonephila clavipes]